VYLKKLSLLLVFCLVSSFTLAKNQSFDLSTAKPVGSSDSQAIKNLLVTSKIAGMCGAFKQLVEFQNYAKVENGMNFITDFLNSEGVRLGYENAVQLMEQCVRITNQYGEISKSFN